MRQSYWKMAAVCFVIAVLTTAYPVSATFINLQTSPGPQLSDAAFAPYLPNSEVISQTIKLFLENAPLSGLYSSTVADIIHSVIDLSSTNISVFFTALRAVNSFLSGAPGIAVFLVAAGTVLTFYTRSLSATSFRWEKSGSFSRSGNLLPVQTPLSSPSGMGHALSFCFPDALELYHYWWYYQTL